MNVVKFDFRVFARSAQTNVHTYIFFSSGGSHGTTHPSEFQTSNLLLTGGSYFSWKRRYYLRDRAPPASQIQVPSRYSR